MKSIIVALILFTSFASLCQAVTLRYPITISTTSCSSIPCPSGTCVETGSGPRCVLFRNLNFCGGGFCHADEVCMQTSEGSECVPVDNTPNPDQDVMPTPPISCSELDCAAGELCIETPGGPECTLDTGCAAVTCAVGTACVVTATGPQCVPVDEPSSTPASPVCVCPAVFDPVCCQFGDGEVRTVGNGCECTGCGTGVEIVSTGECPPTSCAALDCAPGSNCVVRDGVASCVSDGTPSCACADTIEPVCCETASGLETKINACLCGCEPSSTVVSTGECSSNALPPPPDGCLCFALFDPVCCRSTSGAVSQASNSCECECSGGSVVQSGCNIMA